LLYFNARYYDSALGQFLSPDTLVPDAGVLFDYNRYMYVRGNPLKYTDPSGHVAVCFQGGPQANNNKELDSSFYNFCTQSLLEAGYDEDQHGPILYYIYNGSAAKRDAINAILNRGANEPAIVIGYSYGGAAALEVAKELSTYVLYPSPLANEDIPKAYIDLLITIDPERIVRSAPRAVYDNVRLAINIAPVDGWKYEIGPFQGGNDSPIYSGPQCQDR
jgi:pimeloyl-ACP methyl ester carboxylesterase